jgi:hypothetical protein
MGFSGINFQSWETYFKLIKSKTGIPQRVADGADRPKSATNVYWRGTILCYKLVKINISSHPEPTCRHPRGWYEGFAGGHRPEAINMASRSLDGIVGADIGQMTR